MKNTNGFAEKRKLLVELMKSNLSLKSNSVEKAFLSVPREIFFPENLKQFAYEDSAFPIGFNQTISQPSTIAIMLELLELKEGQSVLEIGSGSGYVGALLSKIVGENGEVFGMEFVKELLEESQKRMNFLDLGNVELFNADGCNGLVEKKPFDRILISAACFFVPKPLFEQLDNNGLIVAPIGDAFSQQMMQFKKINGKLFRKEFVGEMFCFVPLIQRKAK